MSLAVMGQDMIHVIMAIPVQGMDREMAQGTAQGAAQEMVQGTDLVREVERVVNNPVRTVVAKA